VGLHIEERITADSSVARMSMLRFNEAGKIIDHWEAMQGQPRRRANPNTMFDGAAVRYISASGARSRDVLVAADLQAFNNYDTLIVRQTRALPYTQHNPTLPDGINAFIQFLMRLKNSGARIIRTGYQKVAEGDFIMTLSNSQTTADVIVFDLLRVNEDGKAVEHWDVLQPLNGADKSKVY
jgi:predicted SnoaL-like aldol condensation-catalyzing enzyme